MTKEEFEVWWKERWSCCTAPECTREAYGLIQELLVGARERIASLLEKEGKTGAASFVRMLTADGLGNEGLDIWPHPLYEHNCGMCPTPGGGGIVIKVGAGGSYSISGGTGRVLHDTTHQYPGLEEWRKVPQINPFPKGKCKNGCGAEMGPLGCSAPIGIDPMGDCPAVVKQ